jgi:hypothetical protein
MFQQALELLDLSTPFIYAAAIYSVFHYLEERASVPAKKALIKWIQAPIFSKEDISFAIVQMFERLYGYPFFSLRTVLRLILYSFALNAFFIYELGQAYIKGKLENFGWAGVLVNIGSIVAGNILSDYLSLFVIRRWLIIGANQPLLALITGGVVGVIIVFVLNYLFTVLGWSIILPDKDREYDSPLSLSVIVLHFYSLFDFQAPELVSLVLPALIIHLWLPLFAVALLSAKLLNWFARVSQWMQWFIKQGRDHPLDAVGYAAALIVFVTVAIFRWVRHWLTPPLV